MRELKSVEVQDVSAGLYPVLVGLGFVWYEADNIQSFVNGFFDGLSDH